MIGSTTERNQANFSSTSLTFPNSHIFVRPKRMWLFGYGWLFGVWLFRLLLFGGSTVFINSTAVLFFFLINTSIISFAKEIRKDWLERISGYWRRSEWLRFDRWDLVRNWPFEVFIKPSLYHQNYSTVTLL